jgi:hypothetical protein
MILTENVMVLMRMSRLLRPVLRVRFLMLKHVVRLYLSLTNRAVWVSTMHF